MRGWVKAALGAGAVVGAAAAFNGAVRWNVGPVPRWVEGEPHFYQWREGAIYYEAAGPLDGPPLLLVHGINAAASSYEMRNIFKPLSEAGFRVYLPDLLGFGRSERPGIQYTADTYVDLWCDFARDVIGGTAVHVIASSLSAAHVVAAAARHSQRFGRLLLVCPTGITTLAGRPGFGGQILQGIFRTPVLGTALFNLLITHPSLAFFLRRQAYADPQAVTRRVIGDYYTASHQPGAKWAPAAFVSGHLNCGVAEALRTIRNPVSLAWGREARMTPVEQAEGFRAIRPDARLHVFDQSGLLPHVEQAAAFVPMAVSALGK